MSSVFTNITHARIGLVEHLRTQFNNSPTIVAAASSTTPTPPPTSSTMAPTLTTNAQNVPVPNIRDDDDDDDDDVRYFSHSATSQNTLDDPSAIIPTVAAPIRGDVDLVSTLKKKKKKKKKTRSPGQELY
ncbi:hypothetical protein SprV_0100342000 [Sparganum proliferum]